MKFLRYFYHLLLLGALIFAANSFLLIEKDLRLLFLFIPAVLAVHLLTGFFFRKIPQKRFQICYHGAVLLVLFFFSNTVSVVFHTVTVFRMPTDDVESWLWSVLLCIAVESGVFWHGIICVYLTSVQLGIRYRVICAICGVIPIVQLFALHKILKVSFKEIRFESEKDMFNEKRKDEQICQTKYPLLFVHGVFFRDSEKLNYWGRIPKELTQNGATVFYGNHESAASVEKSAKELSARIREIVATTGCEKVNIIAHSKGGLDIRYALSEEDIAPMVASLTTINTPHRGCLFVDTLLKYAPDSLVQSVASTYNASFHLLGDKHPDFLAAVSDLTATACKERNEKLKLPDGIYYQSAGSVLSRASSGRFPLNISYHLAKHFEGANDGLVSEESFSFGERYTLLRAQGKRGISHGDMIDLNRENIDGFDVREFYVQIVAQLKSQGL